MAQAGHRQACADQRNIVNYRDMGTYARPPLFVLPDVHPNSITASSTQQYQEFMFLQGETL
jgi:hypothetical protein